MALSDNLHDLEHLIADTVGNAFEGARRALADQIRRRSESGMRDARERGLRELREATARLDGARTQAEVLTALLEEGGRFASRTALFLTFADEARGWAAFGFADRSQGIESLRLSYTQGGLDRLAAGQGAVSLSGEESAELARQLGGDAPQAGVLVPLVLRDRVAAALYADQVRGGDSFVPTALQLLAFTAAQLLETQGTRERAATPTLTLLENGVAAAAAVGAAAGLPLWDPAAVEAAAEQAAAAAPAPRAAAAPPTPSAVPEAPAAYAAAVAPEPVAAPEPPPPPPAPEPEPAWEAPVWEAPAVETAVEAAPPEAEAESEPEYAAERTEAPAPWEELPEEPVWAAPPEAPSPVEEPVPPPAPAWQPSWQMEEATPAAPEPAAEAAAPAVAPEEAWVYTDQGYEAEAEATYEGATVEEVAAEAALDDTASVGMDETGIDTTAMEAGYEEVEEVAAEPIEEVTAPYQSVPEPAPPPPESVTSPLYGGPLYPSEATVRISRDLLQSAAAQPAPPPFEADVSDDSTVMLSRPAVAPAPPPAPPPSPPPAAPPARSTPVFGGGGSTEVQPPPDLEGPGWAFRSQEASTASYRQQTEENAGLHEEARRLARLLVSEIKLYNEEQIEEGRRQRDIYPRLQDDIDRSRQMYEERVDPKVRDEVDYFQQEMVNILAGGDAGALGM